MEKLIIDEFKMRKTESINNRIVATNKIVNGLKNSKYGIYLDKDKKNTVVLLRNGMILCQFTSQKLAIEFVNSITGMIDMTLDELRFAVCEFHDELFDRNEEKKMSF